MSLVQYLKSDGINRQVVNEANPLPVTGEFTIEGGSLAATATAAAPSYSEGQTDAPLSLDLDGALRVTGSFSASTVVTATNAAPSYVEGSSSNPLSANLTGDLRVIAKQSGSYAVTGPLTDTQLRAAAVPVSGTFWQATQPISAASLPLPTGAATSAKQPALGTAGSASTDVITVQGIASGTPLITGGNVAHDAADSGNPVKIGGKANASAPTPVSADGDRADLAVDRYGHVKTLAVDSAGAVIDQTATVNVAQDSNAMKLGATSVTPKFAAISASSSGDNTIVAAVASKKIRVLAYNLMGAGAVNARFQTAAAGAYLTGLKYIAAAGGGICAPFNPTGWFETVAGDLLNLELSAAVAVGGELVYIEV